MKKYLILKEYREYWGTDDIYDETKWIVDKKEIEQLAFEWDVDIEELMQQVIEYDE